MRDDAREQIGPAVTAKTFNQYVPPWDQLPQDSKDAKIALVREEMLPILDRAGYRVVKKKREE